MIERPSEREVVFTRLLAAPSELVWEVWTDPRHLHEWYGPAGFTTFVPDGARTRLSIHMTYRDAESMKTAVERYGVLEGGVQTLERIAEYLSEVA